MVGDQQLAACLTMFAAEELIKLNFGRSSDPSVSLCTSLSSDERDIIAYVSGFVLFQCKKKFSSFSSFPQLVDNEGSTKLISLKCRGGLTQPSCDTVDFFVMMEIIFRNLCSGVSVPSIQTFSDTICSNEDSMSFFYNLTYSAECETSHQESLLSMILSIFHKVRCHARCRQTMEKFHTLTKTAHKQKALRNDI